jgi:hypothetical protein
MTDYIKTHLPFFICVFPAFVVCVVYGTWQLAAYKFRQRLEIEFAAGKRAGVIETAQRYAELRREEFSQRAVDSLLNRN